MKIILSDYEQGCGEPPEPPAGEHHSLWKSQEEAAGGLRVPVSNFCKASQGRRESEAQRCLRLLGEGGRESKEQDRTGSAKYSCGLRRWLSVENGGLSIPWN